MVDVTVTFWRGKNSSSTRENLKLRRESKHVMPLFKIKKLLKLCFLLVCLQEIVELDKNAQNIKEKMEND